MAWTSGVGAESQIGTPGIAKARARPANEGGGLTDQARIAAAKVGRTMMLILTRGGRPCRLR